MIQETFSIDMPWLPSAKHGWLVFKESTGKSSQYSGSVGFPEEDIRQLVRIAQVLATTRYAWNPATELIGNLARENAFLRKEIEDIKQKLADVERKIPEERVIVLREITREKAKQEIQQLFSSGRRLYYSDIAQELRLNLELVVDICHELQEGGEIEIDESIL